MCSLTKSGWEIPFISRILNAAYLSPLTWFISVKLLQRQQKYENTISLQVLPYFSAVNYMTKL